MAGKKIQYWTDAQWYILTEVAHANVKEPYLKAVKDVTEAIVLRFWMEVESVYLYGSIAKWSAKLKTSDMDILLVFQSEPSEKEKREVKELSKELSQTYMHLVREIGIAITNVQEIDQDFYCFWCYIKHLCICVYGKDATKKLPKFKPSQKVAQAFNGDIEKHIHHALAQLKADVSAAEIKNICDPVMRKIVRTGFSLVMEKEKSWTTDLMKSCEAFSLYYPQKSEYMKQALDWIVAPTDNKQQLEDFLNHFWKWLVKEIQTNLLH